MFDDILSLLNNIEKFIHQNETVLFDESGRIASTNTNMKERGSISERLGQTDEEAETIARADAVRLQEPYNESSDLTESELEQIDDEIANRLVEDYIKEKLF